MLPECPCHPPESTAAPGRRQWRHPQAALHPAISQLRKPLAPAVGRSALPAGFRPPSGRRPHRLASTPSTRPGRRAYRCSSKLAGAAVECGEEEEEEEEEERVADTCDDRRRRRSVEAGACEEEGFAPVGGLR
nr:unnamed protein product [Digitaria exilis]